MPALTGGAAVLARLKAQRAATAAGAGSAAGGKKEGGAAQKALPEVTVLYASQTGTAAEIARNIAAEATTRGMKAKVASFNEWGPENIGPDKTPVVVVVAASTGDGDPPDNAAKSFVVLRRKSQPPDLLKGVQFTVLGLGDSNYTRFMYVPRAFKKRFAELGAVEFHASGEVDEVDGLEEGVEGWVDSLWPSLQQVVQQAGAPADAAAAEFSKLGLSGVPPLPPTRVRLVWEADAAVAGAVAAAESQGPGEEALAYRDPEGAYSAEAPFWAQVSGARYLTAPGAGKRVLHMEVAIGGSGMRYCPGDSIGVLPRNDGAEVAALAARLGAQPGDVFSVEPAEGAGGGQKLLPHLRWPATLRHALTVGADISSPPRKSLLRLLAEHCAAAGEREALLRLCSREAKAEYAEAILAQQPSLLQLLNKYPSCKPPLDALLDALPPLAPRMYSIATAPAEHPDQVHVAFSVVDRETGYGRQRGVATTHLEALCRPLLEGTDSGAAAVAPLRLPTFLRGGGAFKPPSELDKPWIMIGPGTGVAPFRGFLQQRRAALRSAPAGAPHAPAWLFFGCRRREDDYLYREELAGFVADGALDKLEVAFSREQASKVYVQHLMRKQGEAIFGMIEEEGYVFVCGDGAGMAKDVHAALAEIIRAHGEVDVKEATEQLAEMARRGRYVRDIWS